MSARDKIFKLLEDHYNELKAPEFIPGKTPVPVGKYTDVEDLKYLIDASLDFWLTTEDLRMILKKTFLNSWN